MSQLKDKELDRYYQERFSTTASAGWNEIVAEAKVLHEGYSSVVSCKSEQELYFRKGQLDILNWLITLGDVARDAYDRMVEQEERDESV